MAHEVESMFFVGETPWHGLGQRLTDAPNVSEAIKQAGLDWFVKTVPLQTIGTNTPVPARATVRESDGSILGVVGERYHVLQNSDAFKFFDPMVESGLVTLETAGSLQNGKRVWILARIGGDSDMDIIKGDAVRKFIMLSNSHDGTLAVRVGFTPVRIVCANTLAMAHTDGQSAIVRLRHHSSVARNLDALREAMNLANQSFEATADQFRLLAQRQINANDLRKFVKIVLGHEHTEDKDLSTRTQNQIDTIETLFVGGRGADLPGVRGTVWAAYNAVTEFLSHAANSNGDKRYASLWFGENAKRNQLALDVALKLAA